MSTSKLTEVKLPAYFYDFELLKQTRLLQVAIEEKEASRPLASFRKAKFLKKNNDFDEYQKFIYISRYSKWSEEQKRRETWPETIRRYLDFLEVRLKKVNNYILSEQLRNQLEKAIHNHEIMPSMRCLMAAGKALDRDNVAGYNCSFLNIDHPRAFDEAMYILMCGTGVGFSVESKFVDRLPKVPNEILDSNNMIIVEDSKIGWAKAFRKLISLLYSGLSPQWDVSQVRPKGAPLKTMGGRASGPDPLVDLMTFTKKIFNESKGRKLSPIQCHDIMCKVGEIVIVGGVRRSALISLSDINDTELRTAKVGSWWEENPHRALANNSACYDKKPQLETFMDEWLSLIKSKSGERGIFNREASKLQALKTNRRDPNFDFGTNPCSEIILRSEEFCNLTECVIRSDDSLENVRRKVRLATILGTFQATLTDFRYLRKSWKENTEEEALLGVSLTGIFDNTFYSFPSEDLKNELNNLKELAIKTNATFAKKLSINQAAAITCIKPSGTVSQLVDSGSGIHPRYGRYYLRTVRISKNDPICKFMDASGIYNEDDVMQPQNTSVFYFPQMSPKSSITRKDLTAMNHLDLWKLYNTHWCEHKPSVTINVKDEEWIDVQKWIWDNFDSCSGVSFLPYDDTSYKQAPYQEITEEEYMHWMEKFDKKLNWNELATYEEEDSTQSSQTLACSSGSCEMVDIVN